MAKSMSTLNKNLGIKFLSLDCFLIWAAFGVYPFIQTYYKSCGLTDFEIGILAASSAMVGLFAKIAWGSFSDRVGQRKLFIMLGCAVFALTMIVYTLISSFEMFLILVLLNSLLAPAPLALIAAAVFEFASPEAKATVYARYRIWGSFGWIFTTLFGGILVSAYGTEKAAFYLATLLYLLAMINSLRIVEPKKRRILTTERSSLTLIKETFKERGLPVFLLILTFLGIAFSMASVFFPIFYRESLKASPELLGFAFAIPAIFEIPITLYVGKLSDKIGRKPLFVLSSAVTSLCYFLYAIILNPIMILPIRPLEALTFAPIDVASPALISDILPSEKQGIGQTLYAVGVWSVSSSIGPFIGGIISETHGMSTMFQAASLIAIASTLLFIMAVKEKKNLSGLE